MRRLATALFALMVLPLAGCGGDDPADAPSDASLASFCRAYAGLYDAEGADESDMRTLQDDLLAVGTPADVPAEVRTGFEVITDPDRTFADEDEYSDLDDQGSAEGEAADALKKYFEQACDR